MGPTAWSCLGEFLTVEVHEVATIEIFTKFNVVHPRIFDGGILGGTFLTGETLEIFDAGSTLLWPSSLTGFDKQLARF